MHASIPSPSLNATLHKYLPAILAVAAAWLLARGLKKLFWNLFAMYWAFHALHLSHVFG